MSKRKIEQSQAPQAIPQAAPQSQAPQAIPQAAPQSRKSQLAGYRLEIPQEGRMRILQEQGAELAWRRPGSAAALRCLPAIQEALRRQKAGEPLLLLSEARKLGYERIDCRFDAGHGRLAIEPAAQGSA